jgi:hypothetical protein
MVILITSGAGHRGARTIVLSGIQGEFNRIHAAVQALAGRKSLSI